MSNKESVGCSSSFTTLLGLLFIGLKLAGYIKWPWIWVLAPFWITMLIGLVVVVFTLLVFLSVEGKK